MRAAACIESGDMSELSFSAAQGMHLLGLVLLQCHWLLRWVEWRDSSKVWISLTSPCYIPFLQPTRCTVHANDLNPRSFHYLRSNAKINKVSKSRPVRSACMRAWFLSICFNVSCQVEQSLSVYNQDGREFLKELASKKTPVHHIIMNLPASGLEFLGE